MIEYTVTEPGERLDKLVTTILSTQPGVEAEWASRTRVQAAIKDGRVIVNEKPGKASYRVERGDVLHISPIDPPASHDVLPEPIPLDVIYEDAALVAINKPAGLVVHPALTGSRSGTLVNAVLYRWPQTAQVGSQIRAGIVHRLDKDTSGVIIIAKTEAVRRNLMAQFKERTVEKRYVALVHGIPNTPIGHIDAPIGRDPHQRKQMAVIRKGKPSSTDYKVLQAFDGLSYLELLPHTGRTHQLRVHLAFIHHPIIGDRVYGFRKSGRGAGLHLKRQFLHAERLTIQHPLSGQPITFRAPLPPDLQTVLDSFTHPKDTK